MVIETVAAFGSITGAFKSATDLIKAITDARDDSTIKAKAAELQTQILSAQQSALTAQTAQFTLLDRVRELEKIIADTEAWDSEKKRYELKAVAPGAFAYVTKPLMGGTEPPHWLCTRCYAEGKASILQEIGPAAKEGPQSFKNLWHCHTCSASIRVPYSILPLISTESEAPNDNN